MRASRPSASPHRRVRSAILGVLAVLAIALAFGVWGQLRVNARSAIGARLVNLAGRQRMLSQSIARDAAPSARMADLSRLPASIERMERDYAQLHGLLDSLASHGAVRLNTARRVLDDAQTSRRAMIRAAHAVLLDTGSSTAGRATLQQSDLFLPQMERTVQALQTFSEDDIRETANISLLVAGVLVLLLILAAALVVEPVVRVVARQHALATQRHAELERLSLAAQRTDNLVVFTDADRRITWVNDGFTRLTGFTSAEAIGQSPGALLQCPSTNPQTVAAIRDALNSGKGFHGEVLNRAKDGRDYWLDLDIQPIHDDAGILTGFLAIETDITEQVLQRERLSSIFDAVTEGVVLVAHDGRIIECNGAAERILGLSSEQIRGRVAVDARWGAIRQDGTALPGEEMPSMITLRTGEALRGVVHGIRLPDGTRRWISVSTEAVRNPRGDVTSVVASFGDVTAHMDNANRLDLVVSGAGLATWDVHLPSGRAIHNPRCAEMLGFDVSEFPPFMDTWNTLLHPDDHAYVQATLKAHLRGHTAEYRCEHRLHRKDGTWAWVLVSGRVTERGVRGEPIRAAGVVMDISTAKLLEARADAAQERFDAAIAGTSDGLWDWTAGSEEIWFSPRCWVLLGYATDGPYPSVSPATFRERLHPDDRENTLLALAALRRLDAPCDVEIRLRVLSEEFHWFRMRCKAQRDTTGRPLRLAGSIQNIDAQKLAELQLQRASASLEEAQAVARMGSWSFDIASGYIDWSRQIFSLFGRDESLGPPNYANMLDHYVDDDAARLKAVVAEAASSGTPYSLVLRTRHGHNGVRFLRSEGRARRDATGAVVGMFGTKMDVTEAVEREEALRQARAEADAANHSKSEFLANMSHEIRTPLTAILGYTDILREDIAAGDASARQTSAVDTIQRAGEHLLSVINDILDLSKIEANKLVIESVNTSLPQLLMDVDSLMRARAASKGVLLQTSLATPIPDRILSDPTRLRQILMNLMGNAAKFTDVGRIDVRALVTEHDSRATLRIEVEDTGPGMTTLQARQLFQPFTQADASVTRRHGGTGLGLTICRRLAGLMGGDVRLDYSAAGRGSRFVLELPLVSAPDAVLVSDLAACNDESSAVVEVSLKQTRHVLHGRILLAEDGEDNQRLIAFHLTRAGADVTIAGNGRIALEKIRQALYEGCPFGLLVTDMQMPEMDGYTLARTLREQGVDLSIVALTAHAMAEDRAKCLDAGCDDYATKPIDAAHLLRTCARWLRTATDDEQIFPAVPTSDHAVLLSDLADDPDMHELIQQFLVHLGARMAVIEASRAPEHRATLATVAHQLKGAAGGYGFTPISDAARDVERFAKDRSAHVACDAAVSVLLARCAAAMRGSITFDMRVHL